MAFSGFNFLDKLLNPAVDARQGVDVLGQKKFIAQDYRPPVSPRSTVVLFDQDDLNPVSPAGDRYRSADEPPAFEVSFVFPSEDLVRLNKEYFGHDQLGEVQAARAEAEKKSRQRAGAIDDSFETFTKTLTRLEAKRDKVRGRKRKRKVDKEIAEAADEFIKGANADSRIVGIDLRTDQAKASLARWKKLSNENLAGIIIGGNSRNDRQIDAPGIGAREDFEQQQRQRREIVDQLILLENTPALTFTVPPKEVSLKMTKVVFDGNLTQAGYQVEHWGDALDTLSIQGSTGGFYSVSQQSGSGGISHRLRRGSRAFQELMALVNMFKSNGYLYHTLNGNAGQVNMPAALIQIQFGLHIFIGRFDEFSITESEDTPFRLEYTIGFTCFETFLYGTDSGEPLVQYQRSQTTGLGVGGISKDTEVR